MINARGGQPPSEGTVGSKKRASLWLAIGRRTAVSYCSIRRAAPLAALRPEVTRCLRNAGCLEDCSCTAGPAVDRGARRTRGALPRNEPLAGCARRACRETFVDPKHPSRLPIARHATELQAYRSVPPSGWPGDRAPCVRTGCEAGGLASLLGGVWPLGFWLGMDWSDR